VVTAAVFTPKPHLFFATGSTNAKPSLAGVLTAKSANTGDRGGRSAIRSRFGFSGISNLRNNNAYPVVNLTESIGSGSLNSSSFSSALNPSASSTSPHSPSNTLANREKLSVGDVIVSADLNGFLKILTLNQNPAL